MADKTTEKRRGRPLTGTEGKTFSKDYQPSPEAKSKGWKERRSEMLLSKAIAEALGVTADDQTPLKGYASKLILLAENGNAEALKQVRQAIEDEVTKVDITTGGEKVQQQVIVLPNGATIPIG